VSRDADLVEMREDVLGNTIVQNAFAINHFMLFGIKSGGIILEKLNKRAGLWAFIQNFGLAFVNATTTVHCVS
jgi:hypothetical protein